MKNIQFHGRSYFSSFRFRLLLFALLSALPALALMLADVTRILTRNFAVLGLLVILFVMAAWMASNMFVLKWIHALLAATKSLKKGDMRARTEIPYNAGEFGELARSFDEMIEAVQKSHVELERRVHERTEELTRLNEILQTEVSVRRKAEQAVSESRKDLQEYIDNMLTFNAKLDTSGHFLLVGKTAQIASGFSLDELMKLNFLEGPWWSFDATVQTRVREAFQKAVSGTPVNYDEEIKVFGDKHLTINFSLLPVVDNEGHVLYVVAEGRDITALKKAEEKLRQSEERFRSLVQTIPDIVYRLDGEGRFIFINNSVECIGYDSEELIGKHFSVLIHPEDVPCVSRFQVLPGYIGMSTGDNKAPKLFDERRTGKRATRGLEVRLMPKSKDGVMVGSVFSCGEIISIGQYDRDVTSNDKQFLGTVGVIRDITERKRAEEALQNAHDELEKRVMERTAELSMANAELKREITDRKQAEEALALKAHELARSNAELEQFAYVASHDLQEPLRKVASYADLLSQKYKGQLDVKADKYIAYMVDGVTRMQAMINDLLAYSRAGRGELLLQHTNMEAVLTQILGDYERTIHESHATVTCGSLPSLVVDPGQIYHLLQNLIGNAIKFHGKESPRIHISAVMEHNEWVFSVHDNGIGIEPEYRERIFIIFQRLHARGEYSGNGIGLAICKKIVQRHGGRIWVESQKGAGSTFYFTLPLSPVSAAAGDNEFEKSKEKKQEMPQQTERYVAAYHV